MLCGVDGTEPKVLRHWLWWTCMAEGAGSPERRRGELVHPTTIQGTLPTRQYMSAGIGRYAWPTTTPPDSRGAILLPARAMQVVVDYNTMDWI